MAKLYKNMQKEIIEIIENNYDNFLRYYYNAPCEGCGFHSSFWKSVIESEEWKLWQKEQSRRLENGKIINGKFSEQCFDMPECEELGIMSANHWREFINFIKS